MEGTKQKDLSSDPAGRWHPDFVERRLKDQLILTYLSFCQFVPGDVGHQQRVQKPLHHALFERVHWNLPHFVDSLKYFYLIKQPLNKL